MKTLIAICILLGTVVSASAQSASYYDSKGSLVGNSMTAGRTTTFYDRYGRLEGTATKQGNSTMIYDRFGRYQGRTNSERK